MQSILVCDDDKQIVEAIDIYLTGEGFEVIKAYDGAEALELLKTHTVNLMILDVMMPGLAITIPYVDHEDEISLKERSEAQNELKNIARLNK